jgi:outer membrane biosynthesis protein TonB
MAVWVIPVVVIGVVLVVVAAIRCVFVRRRVHLQRTDRPEAFGTIGPRAIHQKVRERRQRAFIPAVLTPGSRVTCGIRKDKKSFNFTTHFALFSYNLEDMDDEEGDEENQLAADNKDPNAPKGPPQAHITPEEEEDEEEPGPVKPAGPEQQTQSSLVFNLLFAGVCPCLRKRFKITTVDDDLALSNIGDIDIDSADEEDGGKKKANRPNWMPESDHKPKKSKPVGGPTHHKKKKKKKKDKKKPVQKILSTKEKVDKFIVHMRQKSSKRIIKRAASGKFTRTQSQGDMDGDMDVSESLDASQSVDESAMEESAGPGGDGDGDADANADVDADDVDQEQSEVGDLPTADKYTRKYGVGPDKAHNNSSESNPETDGVEDFIFNPNDFSSENIIYAAPGHPVVYKTPNSVKLPGLDSLTIGYHTTISNTNLAANVSQTISNNGNTDFNYFNHLASTVGTLFSPRINIDLANQRVHRRLQTKQILKQQYGIEDVVQMNSGPPESVIPLGYEVDITIQSMDQSVVGNQWCMYYFDENSDRMNSNQAKQPSMSGKQGNSSLLASKNIRGWYVGYLIGLSMRGPGNYHVRFEVLHTKNLKVDGLYKLDLDLVGQNAYGRKWVIIKPIGAAFAHDSV